MPWTWTPGPGEEDISLGQALIISLNDLLAVAREQLPRKHYHGILDIALRRLTAEWRSTLDDAPDDPRLDVE
jgi:hypothetical protein